MKYDQRSNHPMRRCIIHETVKQFLDGKSNEIFGTKSQQIDYFIQIEKMLHKQRCEKKEVNNVTKKPHTEETKKRATRSDEIENHEYDISDYNPWRILETYQMKKAQDNLTKEKEKEAADRRATLKVLNDQVNAKKEAEILNRLENENFIQNQKHELENWKKGQDKARAEKHEKIALLKEIRQNQITSQAEKRQIETKNCKKEELEVIARATADFEKSKMEVLHRKQLEREKWDKIKLEETEREKKRIAQKKKERNEDIKQMEEYKRKLEKEESMRQELLKKRIAKSQLCVSLLNESGEVLKKKEERKLQDMKITSDFQERERAILERETKGKEARAVQMKRITEYNKILADEKRKREFLAESKEREDYIKINKEREITVASEEESLRIKKIEGQKKYCKALDEQIRSQNVRLVDTENMTEVEKSINRKVSFLNRFVPLYIIGVSFSYFYGISM